MTTGGEIATLVADIDDFGVHQLLDVAAGREAQDAAPGDGPDGDDDPCREAFERERAAWQERWRGLRHWFVSESGRPSQAKLLRSQARSAIPQLLAVVASLNERRTGRSDRSADFRTLARWFAHAPDEAAMHRLWRTAFGLHSARHLTVDADTLAERAEQPVAPSTPWSHAPALLISPQLRRTGSYERRGKPNRVVDRSEARHHLAELAARQADQTARARARLATTRPTRLGDLGELDPDAFALFLRLLGDALATRRPDERSVDTITADGSMRIRLTAVDSAAPVEIHTPDGTIELERATVEARERCAAAARLDEECAEAGAVVEERRRRHTGMQEKVDAAEKRLAAARQAGTDAAESALIDIRHATDVDALLDTVGPDDDRPQRAAIELADRQQRAIIHVSTLLDAKQHATAVLATARGHAEDLAAEAEQLAAAGTAS